MNGFEIILPFLKPIEHLILDDSISEVMVNGPDRIFIEKARVFCRKSAQISFARTRKLRDRKPSLFNAFEIFDHTSV
jgi:Flp pilus assembly CpaF family ATPase